MSLRTYYSELQLPAIRRLIGPVSILAARGKRCFYEPIPAPFNVFGAGADTILLSDWKPELGDGLPAGLSGAVIYDVSDASLLEDPRVIRALGMAHGALAPNAATAALVRAYCPQVVVAPSHVHFEWLRGTPATKPPAPLVILLSRGRQSWAELVEPLKDNPDDVPPLVRWLKACPEIRLVSDDMPMLDALEARVGKGRVYYAPFDSGSWPHLLRCCFLLIAPGRDETTDPIPLFEAAMLGVPTVCGEGYAVGELAMTVRSRSAWAEQLTRMTQDDRRRRLFAEHALEIAREATAVRGADGWLRRVEKAASHAPAIQAGKR
jgi:hypothetical protein